jgi:hypothetical protein
MHNKSLRAYEVKTEKKINQKGIVGNEDKLTWHLKPSNNLIM